MANSTISVAKSDWNESWRLWHGMFKEVETQQESVNANKMLNWMKQLDALLFDKYESDAKSMNVDYNIDDETFDKIMNEVDNGGNTVNNSGKNDDTKENDSNEIVTHADAIRAFVKKPFSELGMYKNNVEYQEKMWKDFCESNGGYSRGHDGSTHYYSCHELSGIINDINDSKFYSIWFDYVRFRINFFNIDLKNLLKSELIRNNNVQNISGNDIKLFFNSFKFYRNECGILPTKYDIFSQFSQYKSIIMQLIGNNFDENENNLNSMNPILIFVLIWNGLYALFRKYEFSGRALKVKDGYGFDFKLYCHYCAEKKIGPSSAWERPLKIMKKEVAKSKGFDENEEEDDAETAKAKIISKEEIADHCRQYMMDGLASTGVFGDFINEWNFRDFVGSVKQNKQTAEKERKAFENAKEECKKLFFANGDIEPFNQMLLYCLQDISNFESYFETTLQDNMKRHIPVSTFIINRMALVIFANLMKIISNNDDYKDDKSMIYPQLNGFFYFMFNFCSYVACYPDTNIQNAKENESNELFYIKQYFLYKNGIFKQQQEYKLSSFNWFDAYFRSDGTILHSATEYHMQHYVELLLKDGFDSTRKNRRGGNFFTTPYDIALRHHYNSLLALFESAEKQESASTTTSNAQSNAIKANYYKFKQQLFFARYFLVSLGCNLKYDDCRVGKNKSEEHDARFLQKYGDFSGLRGGNKLTAKLKNASGMMDNVVNAVISLLEKKMVISEDLMILCFEFCNHILGKNASVTKKFVSTLQQVCQDCLMFDENSSGKNSKKMSKDVILMKQRNNAWFQEYLLFNNIWLCKYGDNEEGDDTESKGNEEENNTGDASSVVSGSIITRTESDNNFSQIDTKSMRTLYDLLDETVNKVLDSQQEYIWEKVASEQKDDEKSWNELLNFKNVYGMNEIRQDCIVGGIKADQSQLKLYEITLSIDKNKDDFDVFSEYNSKIYITKMLVLAHMMNQTFQNEMKRIFSGDSHCKLQSAPVKKYERCVMKSEIKKSREKFPNSACLLDYIRCSATYDTPHDLLLGLNHFINWINNGSSKYIKSIVRIKNGFNKILSWKSEKDCEYCDIKINVILSNGDSNNAESIICEIQFLLKWQLIAKKIGHKCYGVKRRLGFVNSVKNEIYGIDENYAQYNVRIRKLLENDDTNSFIKQVLIQPSAVLSCLVSQKFVKKNYFTDGFTDSYWSKRSGKPLLFYFGVKQNVKLFEFFLNCLYHYSESVLGFSNNEKNEFLVKYFNIYHCNDGIVADRFFWGLDTSKMKRDSAKYRAIETILKSPCFKGINQTYHESNTGLVIDTVQHDCFEYLSMLFEEKSKCDHAIKPGLAKHNILESLEMPHFNDQWLQLIIDWNNVCGVTFDNKTITKCIAKCDQINTEQSKKWKEKFQQLQPK